MFPLFAGYKDKVNDDVRICNRNEKHKERVSGYCR